METSTHNLIEVIEFCRAHNFPGDVVGRWVWIQFDEKPSTEIRQILKDYGFRWIQKRMKWAHNCGHPSRAGQGNPYNKYGYRPILADEVAQVA